MRAIRVHQFGGPEVLTLDELPLPQPGPGQARVKLQAIGVNFIDTYHRSGAYKGQLPLTLGTEGGGLVDAVGPGVTEVKVGDRVGYVLVQGAYADYALVPASRLIPIPETVDLAQATAILVQGITAEYLTSSTFPLNAAHTAVVHAAAGGTGALLAQVARRTGARIIGTVSTAEKALVAAAAGCDHVINYAEQDFEAEVKRLTEGKGVDVVYDSVGKTTFDKSLNCLKPRGYMVLFGQSSGPVAPLDPQTLNAKGSLFLTRPYMGHYIQDRAELLQRARNVLQWLESGDLKARVDRALPLAEAAEAHRSLQARETMGKVLLIP